MPRLIAAFIRHGQYHQLADTPSAHQPFPLTAKGLTQAREGGRKIAAFIAEQQLALSPQIHCSLLLRAWQTAEQIQAQLDPDREHSQLQGAAELAERGLGSAANLSADAIAAIIDDDPRYPALPADWKSNSLFRLPLLGAESLMEAGQRVATYIQTAMGELAETASTDTLALFIGHGAAFRHAAHLLGVLEFDDIAKLSMYHAEPVFLEFDGDRHWQHCAGHWKVRSQHSEYRD